MDRADTAANWARCYHANLTPESKLGALRGAYRDGVIKETLKILKLASAVQLLEDLHQGGAISSVEPAEPEA